MLRTAYYQLRELKGVCCSFCLTVYERKKTNNDNVSYIDKNNKKELLRFKSFNLHVRLNNI